MRPPRWVPFSLQENMPPEDWYMDHVRHCQVCATRFERSAIALHEATHAAVGLELGLHVEWVSIDTTKSTNATRLEASLYPGLVRRGQELPALVTRLADDSLETMPARTLVAMAAPSCLVTGHKPTDLYSHMEAEMASAMAEEIGQDPDLILDWAKREVERCETQILVMARRLARDGVVDLKGKGPR